MKYFLIKVKMGHVGLNKYLPMVLAIKAETLELAIEKARNYGGVKHNHPDWCLEKPHEITRDEYILAKAKLDSDQYWEKVSCVGLAEFENRLVDEPRYIRQRDYKTNRPTFIKEKEKGTVSFKMRKMKQWISSLGNLKSFEETGSYAAYQG